MLVLFVCTYVLVRTRVIKGRENTAFFCGEKKARCARFFFRRKTNLLKIDLHFEEKALVFSMAAARKKLLEKNASLKFFSRFARII